MIEIITDGWPEESKEQVLLDEIRCTYIQNPDCTENRDEDCQTIVLSSRDGGGGKFINIQTDSWSISGDNPDDIMPLIRDFKHRMDDTFRSEQGDNQKTLNID